MGRMLPARTLSLSNRLLHMSPCKGVTAPSMAKKTTAYFAFKISDRSFTERVERLHEAALQVSPEFAPFLVNPNELYQPLLSFDVEQGKEDRVSKVLDGELYVDIRSSLPRHIGFTDFRMVNGRMKAISQHDEGINRIKSALQKALNRHGYPNKNNAKEHGVTVMNLQNAPLSLQDIGPVKMTATAYVDRLHLFHESEPIAQFPSDWALATRQRNAGTLIVSTLSNDAARRFWIYMFNKWPF